MRGGTGTCPEVTGPSLAMAAISVTTSSAISLLPYSHHTAIIQPSYSHHTAIIQPSYSHHTVLVQSSSAAVQRHADGQCWHDKVVVVLQELSCGNQAPD
jgi:photosystem II stability/assembly factor-like uncharacterized protein